MTTRMKNRQLNAKDTTSTIGRSAGIPAFGVVSRSLKSTGAVVKSAKGVPVTRRTISYQRDMYSDQINAGAWNSNRKRPIKDRLGNHGDQQMVASRPQLDFKRQRFLDNGKWKHDLYEEKEIVGIRQPNGEDLSTDLRPNRLQHEDLRPSRLQHEDLRFKLGRRHPVSQQVEVAPVVGKPDLREKLSGPIPPPEPVRPVRPVQPVQPAQPAQLVQEAVATQRRLASAVVRGSTGIASLANLRPGTSRSATALQKASVLQKPSVTPKALPMETDEVAGLLHSLDLSKYLITFQAEEVDMTALQHMGDEDLKELGVPMGPRRKILLAVNGRA